MGPLVDDFQTITKVIADGDHDTRERVLDEMFDRAATYDPSGKAPMFQGAHAAARRVELEDAFGESMKKKGPEVHAAFQRWRGKQQAKKEVQAQAQAQKKGASGSSKGV
jgi:hypothetical protein